MDLQWHPIILLSTPLCLQATTTLKHLRILTGPGMASTATHLICSRCAGNDCKHDFKFSRYILRADSRHSTYRADTRICHSFASSLPDCSPSHGNINFLIRILFRLR
ncbi:hypothetical protein BKA61DRAFT_609262 [Leptodontidium sp. MPI-SDFR-AT-0119]|nr:hypothetical protein BKA61DRAFT_609262 [Leptodontidium sp. MPI-SDFR-AT-0119]